MPIQVLMPALSPTMTEGNLSKWFKKEGDPVASGDVLAEIETDKAAMEVEAVEEGTLGKILVAEGAGQVPVNTPIALILEEGEDPATLEAAAKAAQASAPPPAASAPEPAAPSPPAAPVQPASPPPPPAPAQPSPGGRGKASPLARRLAAQGGLDLAAIAGSGPAGRIVKRDVEAAIAGGGAQARPGTAPRPTAQLPVVLAEGQAYTDLPHSAMRRVIAQRLTQSKQEIPHFYLAADCRVDQLLALRKDLNGRAPEGDGHYKVSVNDFVIRAVALALKKVPAANASWMDDAIRIYHSSDVAVAVATPDGLITPIVRNAEVKGLAEISAEMKDLASRARDGGLAPGEYQGGGFTISNLGMYGVKEFSAIINPPQSCILAVGAGEQRPIVRDGALAIATVMTCTLSCDHRAVDGAVGAEFLAAFKTLIEEPLTMLL